MSPNLVGAVFGLVVGLLGFFHIRFAAARVESKGVGPEPVATAKVLRVVAVADLILMVVIGYFVGPMIVSGAGN